MSHLIVSNPFPTWSWILDVAISVQRAFRFVPAPVLMPVAAVFSVVYIDKLVGVTEAAIQTSIQCQQWLADVLPRPGWRKRCPWS